MAQSDDRQIRNKLLAVWHRERRLFHIRGLCLALLMIVGLVLIDLALDWLFDLPGWARVLLLLANVAALAWIGYRYWWRYLRRFDPRRVSLAVERLHPKLNSLLVTYLQLQPEDGGAPAASLELVAALRQQAFDAASPLDFRGVVDFRRLKKPLMYAAIVLLLFGISSVFAGSFYRVLAIRMTNPNSELGYPTRTRIDSVTGDLIVRQGDPLELAIQVAADSEVPELAPLEIRHGDGPWESLDVAGDDDARFAYSFRQSGRSFDYRFRAGDTKTKLHAVEVVPSPKIVESTVTLRLPEYTGQEPQQLSSLNFEVLEGATVEWEIRTDQSLSNAQLVPDSGDPLDMVIDDKDPQLARATMLASKSLAYGFRWTEREHGFEYEDSALRSMRVTADEAPLVEILPPKPAENATLGKSLAIRFRASDDYGLGQASIVYSLNGGAEMEHALGDLTGSQEMRDVDWKPVEWISGLKEGDSLIYAISATDNRAGERGSNLGRSASLKLNFLSREDYQKAAQKRRDELFNHIKAI
ncbi:MAG: hypothetical protein ACI8XO_001768, partial [Verrucomicrobiales bacterium]